MKKIHVTLASIMMVAVFSCKEAKKSADTTTDEMQGTEEKMAEKSSITLTKLDGSPAYEDASLVLESPENTTIATSGEIDFNFAVSNYELGAQTESENATKLANSGKGQHIHFILNNQPYSAHYEPNFKKELPDGVHHLVAFLSRSYHESVKNENSVVVKKMEIGKDPADTQGLDMEAPTLIYSRPKGTYAGTDATNLMLDFFVLNTTLSENGNKVKATINGEEFTITEWAPYVINGLPLGEVTITLELVDGNGNYIEGPFNKVTRTVTLKS
ncbi:Hypothetical protein I595_29 [Croceitalea dokdonensis DOKDO 023]|uniref:Phosphopeptide-binding protein n=1 Tax=Croceitalea dokdonensis DOKDO 023 TaxID=1300341 RepID=A0A0P7B1R5_9FLAO|nr:hypothetical protein [Croceitalea dokdonensis]KPM33127.1 Hypothetical protein I595_29 [Croceitalea dokdonensis DOKDO 023]